MNKLFVLFVLFFFFFFYWNKFEFHFFYSKIIATLEGLEIYVVLWLYGALSRMNIFSNLVVLRCVCGFK